MLIRKLVSSSRTCVYRSPESGATCGRKTLTRSGLCVFHALRDRGYAERWARSHEARFASAFARLVNNRDGNWVGFVFPRALSFRQQDVGFAVDARWSTIPAIDLVHVKFSGTVNFSAARIEGRTQIQGCSFHDSCDFSNSEFRGIALLQHVTFYEACTFHRAVFEAAFYCRAEFRGHANFTEASFRSSVRFNGWRNVSLVADFGVYSSVAGALCA